MINGGWTSGMGLQTDASFMIGFEHSADVENGPTVLIVVMISQSSIDVKAVGICLFVNVIVVEYDVSVSWTVSSEVMRLPLEDVALYIDEAKDVSNWTIVPNMDVVIIAVHEMSKNSILWKIGGYISRRI